MSENMDIHYHGDISYLRRIHNAYIAMDACEGDWGKQFWLSVIKQLQRKANRLH